MSDTPAPRTRGPLGALVGLFLGSHLSVIFLVASLAAGLLAVATTPREEEPQIVVPFADVVVAFPGASAEEVESLVARPLENLLWQIDGVEHVYSQSRRGMAVVTVRFFVGEDRERSLVKLHNRISMHTDRVPPGVAGWVVKPREIDDVPIVTVSLYSESLDAFGLRRVGEEVLAALEDLEDLSRTEVIGGLRRRVRVRPDAARLRGYGLSLLELAGALRAADASLDAGAFAQRDRVLEVSAGPFLESAADLAGVVVGVHEGRPILLGEVAEVEDGPEEPAAYTRLGFGPAAPAGSRPGGPQESVTLAISKKRGTNAVEVAARILARLEEVRQSWLPASVGLLVTRNSGRVADAKVDELLSSLLFAIVSVVVLISLTMGWREGLVVAAAVPVSFSLSLLVNYLAGYTINRVTLFALILSLGLVVDDPITNVDNIQRHLRMARTDPHQATLDAVEEVLPPVILSTLAIIASFLPMLFITGMMGPYMGPMALNVPLAVTFSTVSALTFVPWLAYQLLKGHVGTAGEAGEDPTPAWLHRASEWVLGPFLASRRRAGLLLGAVALAWVAAMALPALRLVPLKLLPFADKDELQLVVDMPAGTTLERTDAVVRRLEGLLGARPEVTDFQSYVGLASPLDFNGLIRHYDMRRGPHVAELRVSLAPPARRGRQSHTIALDMRGELDRLARELGVRLKLVEVPPGPPVLSTLVAEVHGAPGMSYPALVAAGERLMERMRREPGVVDLDTSGEAPRSRLEFRLDKEKAALHGVDTETVVRTLALGLGGDTVEALHVPHERAALAVEVRLDEAERSSPERLGEIEVKGRTGALVALAELGRFVEVPEDQPIMHKDLRRVVMVTAEMAGRAPVEAILDLQADLAARPLGGGVTVEWAGEGEWRITLRVFRDLGIAFGVALLAIYLLLVVQTSSVSMPLLVMVAIPLTGLGIMPGFWALNAALAQDVGGYSDAIFFTATAMIGMIALGGIVVRNSIVLLEFIADARRAGMPLRQAVIASDAVRFRPIMLTAMTTALGAVPIAFDPIFSGLAWALIFGLLASTLFTLVVVPVAYHLIHEGGAS